MKPGYGQGTKENQMPTQYDFKGCNFLNDLNVETLL